MVLYTFSVIQIRLKKSYLFCLTVKSPSVYIRLLHISFCLYLFVEQFFISIYIYSSSIYVYSLYITLYGIRTSFVSQLNLPLYNCIHSFYGLIYFSLYINSSNSSVPLRCSDKPNFPTFFRTSYVVQLNISLPIFVLQLHISFAMYWQSVYSTINNKQPSHATIRHSV